MRKLICVRDLVLSARSFDKVIQLGRQRGLRLSERLGLAIALTVIEKVGRRIACYNHEAD